MNPIREIISIEPDLVEKDGTTHYIATAVLEDVYRVPTGQSDPPEWEAAQCSGAFAVDPWDEHPPLQGTPQEQLSYVESLHMTWVTDDDEARLV
jgi:hypothetical protein